MQIFLAILGFQPALYLVLKPNLLCYYIKPVHEKMCKMNYIKIKIRFIIVLVCFLYSLQTNDEKFFKQLFFIKHTCKLPFIRPGIPGAGLLYSIVGGIHFSCIAIITFTSEQRLAVASVCPMLGFMHPMSNGVLRLLHRTSSTAFSSSLSFYNFNIHVNY